jgi:hypothetical protein
MVRKLRAKNIMISEKGDRKTLKTLFGDNAIAAMLEFVVELRWKRGCGLKSTKLTYRILNDSTGV